jgi:hypothetical protein
LVREYFPDLDEDDAANRLNFFAKPARQVLAAHPIKLRAEDVCLLGEAMKNGHSENQRLHDKGLGQPVLSGSIFFS